MAWKNSTGFRNALLARETSNDVYLLADDITFTTNKIQSSSSGLGDFKVGHFVWVTGGTNNNKVAKVLEASSSELTFAANTFTAESAGNARCIMTIKGGSVKEIMRNGRLDLYGSPQPADADSAETGTLLASLTLNGNPSTSGDPTNGLNLGQLTSSVLKRALDPSTNDTEVWSGNGLADGTAVWGRWYANNVVTGASTTAIRRDGTVTTVSSGDIVMSSGRDIAVGVPAVLTSVSVTLT